MSDEPADREQGAPQAGVLGNLPHSRPAVRSPRRRTEPPARRAEADATAAPSGAGAADGDAPPDLEAIARGGLAVAGEAASLGLRLAGRAAAAVRDAVERR